MSTKHLLAAIMLGTATVAQAQVPPATPAPAPASPAPAPAPPTSRQVPVRMVGNWQMDEVRSATGVLLNCSATLHYEKGRSLAVGIYADKTILVVGDPEGAFTPGKNYIVNVSFGDGPPFTALAENANANFLLILANPQLLQGFATAATMTVNNYNQTYVDSLAGAADALNAVTTCAQAIPKPVPPAAK